MDMPVSRLDPDHALIALSDRWLVAKREYERLYDIDAGASPGGAWANLSPSAPSNKFYRENLQPLTEAINRWPATSVAGFAAKARVVREDCATEFEQSPGLARLINELIEAR